MTDAYTAHDRTAIYLSGGATNQAPSLSLGGMISSRAVVGMAPQYINPVAGVIIEDATPENGEGVGTITISGDTAAYTPPGGLVGPVVSIAEGERKVLTGADSTNAVRLYRPAGHTFEGEATFRLLDAMNGVLGMGNVLDAARQAGGVQYRAFFIKALNNVTRTKLWITTTGQAAYAVAYEVPTADAIQTIADVDTAPTSVTWVDAVSLATALSIGTLTMGQTRGVWLRRTFPAAGTMAPEETTNLHLQHTGI